MLLELQIRNFLIIESLNLSFETGMTVITGETGAGKSILLDALQFVAGGRADAKLVRTGKEGCEVSAQFLKNGEELVIKRSLNKEGRSKAYINGNLVSVGELKELGTLLLNWVGQYEHQALLKLDAQMQALDRFLHNENLLQQIKVYSAHISEHTAKLEALKHQSHQEQERGAFKNYQLEILQALNLTEHELNELYQVQKKLAASESVLGKMTEMLNLLSEDEENIIKQAKRLEKESQGLAGDFTELENANRLCLEARVNLEEAYHELRGFYDSFELDPEKLAEVEARLSEIHATGRKLQLNPETLYQHYQLLQNEFQGANSLEEQIISAETQLHSLQKDYTALAADLTKARTAAATKLSEHVTREIRTLGMKEGEFTMHIRATNGFGPQGQDQVEFFVQTNPGQKPGTLKESASGGELSRIALVIAVLNAKQKEASTLIFDEVDVGISGAVAEKVGQLLAELSREAQVLCITHLPQVAMVGAHHIHVSKEFKAGETFGFAKSLTVEERIEEVARIMSGENITEHARELVRSNLMKS